MKKIYKNRLFVGVVLIGAFLLGICVWALQGALTVTQYEIALPLGMEGLDGYIIAQISDLHNADRKEELEQALKQLHPNLIVLTGDMVSRDDRDFTKALSVASMAAGIAPTYFVQGNHEVDNPNYASLRQGLEEAGVTVLEDESVVLEYNDTILNLVGVKDISAYSGNRAKEIQEMGQTAKELFVENAYHVLLSHRPSLLDTYAACGADLVFSGHAHGGQIRLPGVGALFAPDEGFLPKITEGVHTAGQAKVVVSRGLGNRAPVPRLWNGPELVAVTLRAQESLSENG